MKLSREKILNSLLLTLTESKYLNNFPHKVMHHYSTMGYTAMTNKESNIRVLLETMATSLAEEFNGYELPEPKKLTRIQRRAIEKERKRKEKEDIERFAQLEQAWQEDKPRAEKELLDNAEKAAQNIFGKINK